MPSLLLEDLLQDECTIRALRKRKAGRDCVQPQL